MACGDSLTPDIIEKVEASGRGENCKLNSKNQQDFDDLMNPANVGDKAVNVGSFIENIPKEKFGDPEFQKQFESLVPLKALVYVNQLRDDQNIVCLSSQKPLFDGYKTPTKEEIEQYINILVKADDDTVIIPDRSPLLSTSLRGGEKSYPKNLPPVIEFENVLMTKGNLRRMMRNLVDPKKHPLASVDANGKIVTIHHHKREATGPFVTLTEQTHQLNDKKLHAFTPRNSVDHEGLFISQKREYYEWYAKEYLGDWFGPMLEIFKEEQKNG